MVSVLTGGGDTCTTLIRLYFSHSSLKSQDSEMVTVPTPDTDINIRNVIVFEKEWK